MACHNILPTKVNLLRRNITTDDLCPLCEREKETTGHILWSCPSARDVWMECGRKIQKFPSAEEDFIKIFPTFLPSARDVWMECGRKIQKFPSAEEDFIKIFATFLDKLDDKEV
jgi:hypothetical protein